MSWGNITQRHIVSISILFACIWEKPIALRKKREQGVVGGEGKKTYLGIVNFVCFSLLTCWWTVSSWRDQSGYSALGQLGGSSRKTVLVVYEFSGRLRVFNSDWHVRGCLCTMSAAILVSISMPDLHQHFSLALIMVLFLCFFPSFCILWCVRWSFQKLVLLLAGVMFAVVNHYFNIVCK